MQLVFIQMRTLNLSSISPAQQLPNVAQSEHARSASKVRRPISITVSKSSSTSITAMKPDVDAMNQAQNNGTELNRDVGRISQLLERDLRFEEQKLQAAKPPNQIVREYWDKQNHPYKDKWDELAHKIEKAGKARDVQIETFKAWDGTQISKIEGRCYKAPDPGRTYLHQAEVRQVICPR